MCSNHDVQNSIEKSWAGRRPQINRLVKILQLGPRISPTIFVHGPPSTGKSGVVKDVLRALRIPFCHVTGLEADSSTTHLWTHVVEGLRGPASLTRTPSKIEDVGEAIHAIRKICSRTAQVPYIVVDPVQPTVNPDLLCTLLRMSELLQTPIGIILISPVPWEHGVCNKTIPEPMPVPIIVSFPAYTSRELLVILLADRPSHISLEIYTAFLHRCILPAVKVSRQLIDLQMLVHCLLPCLNTALQASPSDTPQPWQVITQILPDLQAAMNHFQQDFSGVPMDIHCKLLTKPTAKDDAGGPKLTMELPYLSKFLLVAAYIAASNKSSADKRLFDSGAGPKRRRNQQAADRQAEDAQQESTKSGQVFLLERWLQIFWKLIQLEDVSDGALGKEEPQSVHHDMQAADILLQIRHLVTVKLVNQVGGDSIEGTAFIANVSADLARSLARNLQMDLNRFLVYV